MTERTIPLGITEDDVALGSHLVYLWQTDEEFAYGVRFLELGIANMSEFCVLFGQDEPAERVLKVLRKTSPDLDSVLEERRFAILRCDSSASATLANIEAQFRGAIRTGATAIRFLGTLGMGGDPFPGKQMDEAIELENGNGLGLALSMRDGLYVRCQLRFRSRFVDWRLCDTSSDSLE